MTLTEFAERVRRGELSPEDVVERVMTDRELGQEWRARCEKYNKQAAKRRSSRNRAV